MKKIKNRLYGLLFIVLLPIYLPLWIIFSDEKCWRAISSYSERIRELLRGYDRTVNIII